MCSYVLPPRLRVPLSSSVPQLFDLDVDVKQLRELAGFSAARLPVAHWALDGDAADSGAIFGGTIEGAVPTEDRVAAAGRALLLQPGHYVQLPGVNLAELTLMAWVRPDTAPAAATALVCKGWAGPGGWCLRWLASRKLQFVCRAGGSEVAVESDAAQAPGQWVHVAGTCDRSEVTLVVNGVRQRAAGAMDGLPGQNAAPVVVGTPGAGAAHSYGLPAADQFAGAVVCERQGHRPALGQGGGRGVEEEGTWAAQKHSEAGYGRPVDRGVWTAKTVKRPRQQPAHPQYANYWAPLTRKRHIMPHSAQSQRTNYWAPRTRKRHQQEHRPQRPTESSDPTQHAQGRTGDRPGPRKGATTRRNVTQGVGDICGLSNFTALGTNWCKACRRRRGRDVRAQKQTCEQRDKCPTLTQ